MADRERDLIRAMDHRAEMAQERYRRQNTLEIGVIKQVTFSGASVQLAESGRFLRNVPAIQGVELIIGATVIVARIGRADWRIIGAMEAENAITATRGNTNVVAQPQNLTTTEQAGYCAIEWDAAYFLINCYELQVNASAGETGATTIITDNSQYDYYASPATYYARVRAVGENYDRGSWTDWTSAPVGEPSTFLDLSDTPGSYSGEAGNFVRVAAGENELEFASIPDEFTELTDTPGAYSGEAGKFVKVAAGETELEFADLTESDITDLDHTDDDAIHDNVSGEINAVAEKASPVDADILLIEDSEDTYSKKKISLDKLSTVALFTDLEDTPSTLSGSAGKAVAVNSGATALEFTDSVAMHSLLWTQVADVEVASTTDETSLIEGGRGRHTLSEDELDVGTVIRIRAGGYLGTTGAPTLEIAAYLGGNEICSTDVTTMAYDQSSVGWRLEIEIVCRSTGETGTVIAGGTFTYGDGNQHDLPKTTATTTNTTAEREIDVTATWGTGHASNTITCQFFVIEKIEADTLSPASPTGLTATEA